MMEPAARSLVFEVSAASEVDRVNVLFGAMVSAMQILGGVVNSIHWDTLIPGLVDVFDGKTAGTAPDLFIQGFLIGVFTLMACSVAEEPYRVNPEEEDGLDNGTTELRSLPGSHHSAYESHQPESPSWLWQVMAFMGAPVKAMQRDGALTRYLLQVFFATLLGSAAVTGTLLYASSWMGETVMHGDPDAAEGSDAQQRFVNGSVVLIGRSNTISGIFAILLSPLLAQLLASRWARKSSIYGFMSVLTGVVNASFFICESSAFLAATAFGCFSSLRLIIQFTMRYDLLTVDDRLTNEFASTLAFVNIGNCAGQSVGSLLGSALSSAGASYEWMFCYFGLMWFLSGALIYCLPDLSKSLSTSLMSN
eukprot:TRINITY_DN27054_c0_g1_i2.p1 TRINITY_DN27054_c0_g1~~TRINITY_DN27054_c0_g1_i2.p1  ORF type:complete len:364 (-),score=42.58 TRINITY_DN27054_c0_g1_i2:119-1210(-)